MNKPRRALVVRTWVLSLFLSVAIIAGGSGRGHAAGGQLPPSATLSPSASAHQSTLQRYCISCHNQRLNTAGLALDTMDLADLGSAAPVWEKVLAKLRSGAMPPVGRPRPDKGTYDGLMAWVASELDRAAGVRPHPGPPAVHRLNRTEYANVIRDLLALEIDANALLPADDAGYGFDNNAAALTLSPVLLERYMSAARKIARLAIGDPSIRPVAETYRVSTLLRQDGVMSEDLPFGSRGGLVFRHQFPLDGEYVLKIRLQREPASGAIRGLAREPQQIDVRLDGTRIATFAVGGPATAPSRSRSDDAYRADDADAGLEVRFPVKAGKRSVGVSLMKGAALVEGMGPTRLPVWTFGPGRAVTTIGVDTIHVEGPFNPSGPGTTPSRERILVCRPTPSDEEDACARAILSTLARRAYRRPVALEDVDTLLAFYKDARAARGFEGGIQAALEGILVDPEFLFRFERVRADTAGIHSLTDLELATGLSFFLWSSIPDDELLEVATRGELKQPAVLTRQVGRMLADPRARALVTGFAAQWLHLRNMRAVTPDVNAFPEFDDNLREAFVRETELFVESQLREDRSVTELLTANYTFVNERLARHYGIAGVHGSRFRRVTFPDQKRGGLLGHGSILTVTSYATRTSPVVRGKWVLENILGAPPPPPPPDVPALPDRGKAGQPASVRERLEQHRSNPVCSACHAPMDPLGFALENLDGIGKWRDAAEGNLPIDASGTMPDGTTFTGPAELRDLLRTRGEEFVVTLTTKLLTYALGRGVEHYDMPAVRKIVGQAASDDYRWSSIIRGVIESVPFRMRRSAS